MRLIMFAAVMFTASPVFSQDGAWTWTLLPDLTSANLAAIPDDVSAEMRVELEATSSVVKDDSFLVITHLTRHFIAVGVTLFQQRLRCFDTYTYDYTILDQKCFTAGIPLNDDR